MLTNIPINGPKQSPPDVTLECSPQYDLRQAKFRRLVQSRGDLRLWSRHRQVFVHLLRHSQAESRSACNHQVNSNIFLVQAVCFILFICLGVAFKMQRLGWGCWFKSLKIILTKI